MTPPDNRGVSATCERSDSYSLKPPDVRAKCSLAAGHDGVCNWHPAYGKPRGGVRTWVLDADIHHYPTVKGPNVPRGAPVKVVELQPVLEMLKRATLDSDVAVFDGREIIAFIAAHNRGQS